MYAMQLDRPGVPLQRVDRAIPRPTPVQLLVRVIACGVCRTDLHVVDGDLPSLGRAVIPGHEIVGVVAGIGADVRRFREGDRVGIPWLGFTCGTCTYCVSGRENLCDAACFTGYQIDGGYAQYAVADARYCFALPSAFDDAHAAPLLCAGLIGYRALVKAGDARRLGIYGFGAAAHIVTQLARFQRREVYAFTRPGDRQAQQFARDLGAQWAGSSEEAPPVQLDAAIIFAPIGALVPAALRATVKGGRVVCAGIHMSDIPAFPYRILWGERELVSVANLTRADGEAFMQIAADAAIRTEIDVLPLARANDALTRLRRGDVRGAFVLMP